MTLPPVTLEDLSVSLGGQQILSGVSLEVESGTLLGLIGPNGAGKTTLLRTIAGMIKPDQGTIWLTGDDVTDLSSRAVSRRVATLPQESNFGFDFSVREIIEMGRHPHRDRFGRQHDPELIEDAMTRTDVSQFEDRPVTTVSGGERQRVLLARALVQDTPILLLDEPTASLDVNHQIRTLELVRELVSDGKTVVAAIHDLDLAARYCDELALLADGELLTRGSPKAVLETGPIEQAFDASVVVSRDPVTAAPSITALPDSAPDRNDSVHVVCGNGSGAGVLPVLVAAGYKVSVGVLSAEDPDTETAKQLGCDVISVPPYSPIEGAVDRAIASARDADVTLLCDVSIGQENEANLEIIAASDTAVLLQERSLEERNYAGEWAGEQLEKLQEDSLVTDRDHLLSSIARACESTPNDGAKTDDLEVSADVKSR